MTDYSIYDLRKIESSYKFMYVNESNDNFTDAPMVQDINPSMERFAIDNSWCSKWYNLFNRWYFSGRLPSIPVRAIPFKTDTTTLGLAYYDTNIRTNKVYAEKIELNTYYASSEFQFMCTLLHEMVHILDYSCFPEHYENKYYKAHGAWFHEECNRINKYGWNIWTYDQTKSKLSNDFYNEKLLKKNKGGKVQLFGIVTLANGKFFITKTDSKDMNNNITACMMNAVKAGTSLKSIEYYELSGCKLAVSKNYYYYWKSKYQTPEECVNRMKELGCIPNDSYYVYVADENSANKSSFDFEIDNIESSMKKFEKSVYLALASAMYNTVTNNADDNYDYDKKDISGIELNYGTWSSSTLKSLNGENYNVNFNFGNYKEGEKLIHYNTINVYDEGLIQNSPDFAEVFDRMANDLEWIKELGDEMMPESMLDKVDPWDYREDIGCPKVVANKYLTVNMKETASKIAKRFIELMRSKSNNDKINEDADEDDYDVRFHNADDYARKLYSIHKSHGDNVVVSVIDDNTVSVGME